MVPKLGFSSFSQGCVISFLDIAQGCSLGQCLTSSRAQTYKKILWPKLGPNKLKSNLLVFSDTVELLHLVCNTSMGQCSGYQNE